MSAHGSDYKLSDSFLAGIRTVAAIDKAKGKNMSHEITIADEYKAERDEFEMQCITLLAQNRELVEALDRLTVCVTRTELFAEELASARALLAKLGKGNSTEKEKS